MREGWELKKLGNICDILDNKRKPITKKDRVEGDIPYYGATGILSYVKDYLFDETLILLGEDGAKWECGDNSAFAISGKTWVNNHAHVIRPHREILDDSWLIYNLNFQNLMPFVSGMTVPKLNQGNMKQIPIPVPPLKEQKQIVSTLDKAFKQIDQAKANLEQNLHNAKELLDSFLEKIFEDNISGQNSVSLNSICELIVDCEHKTAPTEDEGYPSIRTPNIGFGELILDNVNRVSEETYKIWTRRAIPQENDLILAREAPAGNIAVIPKGINVCLGQRTVLLRPKKDILVSKYLAYLILSKNVQEKLLSHSKGATVGHINMKDIRAFDIYNLPSIEKQDQIVKRIENVYQQTQELQTHYQQKLNNLEELKKSILQKAFSGEL